MHMLSVGTYRVLCLPLIALVVAEFATPAQAGPYVLGVMGDSISAGDGSSTGSNPNWVIQLQTLGQVSIPPSYDVAQAGDTAADLASQYPTIVSLASAQAINASVLIVGSNDAGLAAYDFISSGYSTAVLSSDLNTTVSEIEQTISAVAATGIHQVVANIPDIALTPLGQQLIAAYGCQPVRSQLPRLIYRRPTARSKPMH